MTRPLLASLDVMMVPTASRVAAHPAEGLRRRPRERGPAARRRLPGAAGARLN